MTPCPIASADWLRHGHPTQRQQTDLCQVAWHKKMGRAIAFCFSLTLELHLDLVPRNMERRKQLTVEAVKESWAMVATYKLKL